MLSTTPTTFAASGAAKRSATNSGSGNASRRKQQREREVREAREHRVAQQAAAEAARQPDPVCEKCEGPMESSRFEADPLQDAAPPADGAHCAGCRIQLAEPTSRFGRMSRRLVDGDERYPRR